MTQDNDMEALRKVAEEEIKCGVCGLPIHPQESGVRHFGFYVAHSEQRCVSLLRSRLSDAEAALVSLKEERGSSSVSLRAAPDGANETAGTAGLAATWRTVANEARGKMGPTRDPPVNMYQLGLAHGLEAAADALCPAEMSAHSPAEGRAGKDTRDEP